MFDLRKIFSQKVEKNRDFLANLEQFLGFLHFFLNFPQFNLYFLKICNSLALNQLESKMQFFNTLLGNLQYITYYLYR